MLLILINYFYDLFFEQAVVNKKTVLFNFVTNCNCKILKKSYVKN